MSGVVSKLKLKLKLKLKYLSFGFGFKLILEVQHTFTTAVGLQQDCSSMKGLGRQLGPHGIYVLPCCKLSAVSVAALSRGRPRGSEVWKYVTFQAVEDVSQCQVKTKDGP